jgi:hypothetical protein
MRKEKSIDTLVKKEQIFFNDICSTCNDGDFCVTKKTRKRPIWFCEEFDDHTAIKEQPMVEAQFQSQISTRESDSSRFKGLCINCESRHTCKFIKPNGGIWHCEEYK